MGYRERIKAWIDDLLSIVYPPLCEVCGQRLVHGERHLCVQCNYNLPRCNFHQNELNPIHQRMMRKLPIDRAGSYFYYLRDSKYTNLIQSAKYRNRPNIAANLTLSFVNEIKDSGFFNDIDIIVAVPMHWFKKLKRGFNQADVIADALSSATGIPVATNLKAIKAHSTQTRKSAHERWENQRNRFAVENPQDLEGKHILIVDDVITTGSTIAACCEAILKEAPSASFSILTLAATKPT